MHGAAHRVLMIWVGPQGVAGGGAAAGGHRVRGSVQPAEVLEGGAAPPADQLWVLVRAWSPAEQAACGAGGFSVFNCPIMPQVVTWKWLGNDKIRQQVTCRLGTVSTGQPLRRSWSA